MTKQFVRIKFIATAENNKQYEIDAQVGESIFEAVHHCKEIKVPLEGACEGSLACSTCHIILEDKLYDHLEDIEEHWETEDDMLDKAFGLTPTSRLGCQVIVTADMQGSVFTIPSKTFNQKPITR